MARPQSDQPTDVELEILKVLWTTGPAQLGTIRKALQEQRGKEAVNTTVATMLQVMLEKGMVARESGPRGYLWAARLSEKVTARKMLRRLVNRVFDGSAKHVVAHLLEDGKLSDQDRDEIVKMLNQRGKQHF